MEVQIKKLTTMYFAGKSLSMSLAADRTRELWASFGPHLRKVENRVGPEFYNIQFYPEDFHRNGVDPQQAFVKWAAVAVKGEGGVPDQMEALTLPKGLYAVFEHKGPAATFPSTLRHIYGKWLPESDYLLDHRPHFEVLPENYRPDDPEATEEVWIPIRPK